MPLDTDWRIRLAAFARLSALHQQKGGSDLATAAELNEGFEFEGQRIRLVDLRRGIWKPRKADAALTLFTTPPKPGKPAPYDDDLDESTGHFIYRYQRGDRDLHTNRAARRAGELGRP